MRARAFVNLHVINLLNLLRLPYIIQITDYAYLIPITIVLSKLSITRAREKKKRYWQEYSHITHSQIRFFRCIIWIN